MINNFYVGKRDSNTLFKHFCVVKGGILAQITTNKIKYFWSRPHFAGSVGQPETHNIFHPALETRPSCVQHGCRMKKKNKSWPRLH